MAYKTIFPSVIPLILAAGISPLTGMVAPASADSMMPSSSVSIDDSRDDTQDDKHEKKSYNSTTVHHGHALYSSGTIKGHKGMWIPQKHVSIAELPSGGSTPILTEYFLSEDALLFKVETVNYQGHNVTTPHSVSITPHEHQLLSSQDNDVDAAEIFALADMMR